MTSTPEQISEIVLKVLKEVNEPNVSLLSYKEKEEIARNPSTPAETLKVLATDDNWWVRYGVTLNPSTPVETLKVLATDENSNIRWAVASNPNYKSKTLELTTVQYNALKTLLASSQDETLKTLTL